MVCDAQECDESKHTVGIVILGCRDYYIKKQNLKGSVFLTVLIIYVQPYICNQL